ncbi:LysR family transcriptional regulator [Janibacter melonis]|uniref:LysR family transcriptional regulator n=1 Tax=Janibacter melonis TaxID=262209 RepID=UPI0027E28B66|nr:LysR family transcriptional regulator [Janibacter melonis]
MDLVRHLQLFVAVAEHRHFGRAAASLSMAQPPLSQGVQRLERHLGQRLFDRDARRVELTPAGAAVLPAARQLLTDVDALVDQARTWTDRRAARIGLAADLDDLAGRVLAHLTATGLDVDPQLGGSTDLVGRVRDGDLDAVLVRHPLPLDGLLTGDVLTIPARLTTGAELLPIVLPPRGHHPAAHDQVIDTLLRLGHLAPVHEITSAQERTVRVQAGLAAGLHLAPPRHDDDHDSDRVIPVRYRVAVPVVSEQRPGIDHAHVLATLQDALR